jgi:signal transduction histidine kinase
MLSPVLDIVARLPQRDDRPQPAEDAERLLRAIQDLSSLRDIGGVMSVVREAARELSGADGVTFVLPEGDLVHYADEDAIAPLWKGRRFPAGACISGWAMIHRQTVVIEDIYEDPRIPADAYRPTFVKSLAMIPIRREAPLGAIGAYWARHHRATQREVELLEALAGATAVALANAQLYEEARRAARARDDFIAAAAHELRTPLTSLRLQVDALGRALERQGALETSQAAMTRVGRQVERLGGIVDALLDVSSLGTEAAYLKLEEIDLTALAREVVGEFGRDLPPGAAAPTHLSDGPLVGRWDRARIVQVLQNLLSNAVKFGEGKPIEVTVGELGGAAQIAVRDHGMGIAPADHRRIFERFERAVSTRQFGGFGIGLWVVRQITEAHRGTISVGSRSGEGANFTVVLPR